MDEEGYRFAEGGLGMLDGMNRALNSIDSQLKRLKKLGTAQALASAQAGAALENSLTANYKNGEDGLLYPPKLREDIEGLALGSGPGPVLQTQYQAAALVRPRYDRAMTQVKAWLASARAVR